MVRLPSYPNLAIDIDAIGIWPPAGIVATLSRDQCVCVFFEEFTVLYSYTVV